MGFGDRDLVKAACPLAGGGVNQGSTCGVVTGGCLGLVLASDVGPGDPGRVAALYERLRDFTAWFRDRFGSTLCRERIGVDLANPRLVDNLLMGRMLTRCMSHIGPAAEYLTTHAAAPLASSENAGARAGYCAAPVLEAIRERTGRADEGLERVSMALDGGIGLSGGLCGALAGAILALGSSMGYDPREIGLLSTLSATAASQSKRKIRAREDVWGIGITMAREFRGQFGSLECRDISGRTFSGVDDLAECVVASESCARAISWCSSSLSPRGRGS
ncbi:MAG: C-GCAxxG-C-C family protein, partial [Actinomycetota bacterium]